MTYFLDNWGSFVGALGLAASIGGLVFAYLARRAAKSAEAAALEARQALTRTLRLVDVQEAIDLIDRLKDRLEWGESAIVQELYSSVQSKLSGVQAALPVALGQYQETIAKDLQEIAELKERTYRIMITREMDTDTLIEIVRGLNSIQGNLRRMLNEMMFSDEGRGA